MIRSWMRRPQGPAEIAADTLRVLGVISILVAGVGWGVLSSLSFVSAVLAMLLPRVLRVRPAFDILFCVAVLMSTWSSVMGIYYTTRWWDLPMHFLTNGLFAAMLYVLLVRLHVLADAETLPHPMLSGTVMVTALGFSLGVLWEFFEWFGLNYIDPHIYVGYVDTLGDLVQGALGSVAAGLSMRFLAAQPRPRRVAEPVPSAEAGRAA
jgi:hypothetical protein